MKNLTLLLFVSPLQITLGLFKNDKIINSTHQMLNQDLIENLFPALLILLTKEKTDLKAISEIFAGIGPGSYTSGRVVATFLRTMKTMQENIKIFTINNLLWLAGPNNKMISLITANKKEFFLGVYDQGKTVIKSRRILKEDLSSVQNQYSNFELIDEKSTYNLETRFQNLKSYFHFEEDYEKITPITDVL